MAGGSAADLAPTAVVKIFSAGTAGCVADLVTFPLDTAKVRLQVTKSVAARTCGMGFNISKTGFTAKLLHRLVTLQNDQYTLK